MTYRRRIVDEALDELFPHLAAISLESAKGVGKTATATERVKTVIALDNPAQHEIVSADLSYITQVPTPVLIDEWQLLERVWDRVRRAVDADNTGSQFLLAGSAEASPSARIHSGAGRIVRLTMRPLSLTERGLLMPTVSLAELLTGSRPTIGGQSGVDLSTYSDEILGSGFPGLRELPDRPRKEQLDGYLRRIVERDLSENGVATRRPPTHQGDR